MTSKEKNLNFGPPPPITKLTTEQDLRLRLIKDQLNKDEVRKEDIITVYLALQKQNFVLSNSLMNLVESWPKEPTAMFGILI